MKLPTINESGEKHTVAKRFATGIVIATLCLGVVKHADQILDSFEQAGADVAEMIGHIK